MYRYSVETWAESFYTGRMRKITVYLKLLSCVCLIESALAAPDVAIIEDKALAHTAQILE